MDVLPVRCLPDAFVTTGRSRRRGRRIRACRFRCSSRPVQCRWVGRRPLQPDVHAAALVFEFFEPVLLHEREQTSYLGKVHAARVRSCSAFWLWFLGHLEFEKFPGSRRQIHGALCRHQDVVLDPDAPKTFQVDARLNGHDHPVL